MRSPGFVCVMVNAQSPQFVRVGRTDGHPEDTAQEANLQLRDAAYFSDAVAAQGCVQDYLETFQTGQDPELFEVPVEIALKGLSLAMERHVGTRANLHVSPSLYDDEPVVADGSTAESLYQQGVRHRTSQNAAEALKYFKRAARLAEPGAFLALAEMTEHGEGCRADKAQALEWLNEGTRANVRECWGALADRQPQTKYFRGYFDGMQLSALTPEQRQAALHRMRAYLQAVASQLEADDARIIESALPELKDRELSREWQRCRGKSPSGRRKTPVLLWAVALTMAAAIGILVPRLMQRASSAPAAPPANEATAATDTGDDAGKVAPGAKTKTRVKGNQAQQKSRSIQADNPIVDQPANGEPTKPPYTPPHTESQVPLPKTPAAMAETPAKKELSGEELREQFNWGKEKADAGFKDSEVKITDVVSKVGKHDISFKKIKCKFNGAPPDRIQPGMTITVEGTVHGKGFWTGTISMDNCRVLPR